MTNQLAQLYELYAASGFKVSTDTRKIEPGSIFFALKGDNFNGNTFALTALGNGALYAVVDEKSGDDERLILVDDALKCLQDLACLHRRNLGVKVLGIGGSNGKTTSKELIVSVLSTRMNTHFTKGNLNNHIGVPLTLLQLRPEHEIAVIELGANKMGDIEELCLIAEPSLGIITNIGKEHLEGFGGMEGVARAESELFDYLLKHNGHAFVNLDDSWLAPMGDRLSNKSTYGITHSGIKVHATEPGIDIGYKDLRIHSVLMGAHNLQNIVATVSVAEYFDIPPDHVKMGIEQYRPANNRSQLVQTSKGNTVLLDAYNANPSSVEMALVSLEKMSGPKVALLGDMFELGAYEASEHQHIADLAKQMDLHQVILVGKAFSQTNVGDDGQTKTFPSKDEAFEFIRNKDYRDCTVLIKGSRGMKMEDFLAEF